MSDVEEVEVDDISSISSGSEQGDQPEPVVEEPEPEPQVEEAEPEPEVEEPKPEPVKKKTAKPATKKNDEKKEKKKKKKTRVMKKKKVTKSAEQDAEDGELQEEEANTESFETMERQVRRFTYKNNTYFLDKEDLMVYNDQDEYVGDYDKEKGEVKFINM